MAFFFWCRFLKESVRGRRRGSVVGGMKEYILNGDRKTGEDRGRKVLGEDEGGGGREGWGRCEGCGVERISVLSESEGEKEEQLEKKAHFEFTMEGKWSMDRWNQLIL